MLSPPAHLLYHWVWTLRARRPGASAKTIQQDLQIEMPLWTRILKILGIGDPNCALLFAHSPLPTSRDQLVSSLCLLRVEDAHGDLSILEFAKILGEDQIDSIAQIYPRHPHLNHWYYEAFATFAGGGLPENRLASSILGRLVKGDVLITGTTPGEVRPPTILSGEELGKTLWYYLAAGIKPSDVARERNFERFLGQTVI
ncbi:hypothetical protein R3P38DRAFT_3236565 [Favolaschia claudopus]|uniref:Uncharacterized protein n=1 Tax=Favolaschia claudopus TaxID=2862362 RepID=A0AAV9ZCI1_9AGAR